MPANLTPQYQKAENEYRRAQSTSERIACLERMLQLIPKHKGTEKLQADLKSKLKETRADVIAEKRSEKKGRSYKIPRQGAGQVIIVGSPNSGKSRIVAELTNAEPEVAVYPFTTREPTPAMMPWEDVFVQLVDTPPITEAHPEPYLVGMVRVADLVLLCLNGASDDGPDETAAVFEQLRTRKTILAQETRFDEADFSIVHVKTLLVVTHSDDPGCTERVNYFAEMFPQQLETICVELSRSDSANQLREAIYRSLNLIRVYTKRPGKPVEFKDPFTLPAGGTVEDLAALVHKELAESLKFAKVWGTNLRDGQNVGREHILADGDVVELH